MPTLAEQKRQTTADHLVAAALRALVERGIDVTVDDIARAAGVSRRTVFRHFATRDELLADAIRSALSQYSGGLPAFDAADWRTWLAQVCLAIHEVNATYGQVELDLGARRDLSAVLAAASAEVDRFRHGGNLRFAERLWSATGGSGKPPAELVRTVGAHSSPYFTFAVLRGGAGDKAFAARLSNVAILAALSQ